MLQNTTYSEFDRFPSSSEDPFRSIQSNVFTEGDEIGGRPFIAVGAELRLADGSNISGFYANASGFASDPNLLSEIGAAREDLDAFKQSFDGWYETARTALAEAHSAVVALQVD